MSDTPSIVILSNGNAVIGYLVGESIVDPCIFGNVADASGASYSTLIYLLSYANSESFSLKDKDVMTHFEVNPVMAAYYDTFIEYHKKYELAKIMQRTFEQTTHLRTLIDTLDETQNALKSIQKH